MPDMPRQACSFQNRYDHPGCQKTQQRNDENPGNQQIQEPEFRPVRCCENAQNVGHGRKLAEFSFLDNAALSSASSIACKVFQTGFCPDEQVPAGRIEPFLSVDLSLRASVL